MQYSKPWGSSWFLKVQGTITNAERGSLYYSELRLWKSKVNSEFFCIRWLDYHRFFFLPDGLGTNASIFLVCHILLIFFINYCVHKLASQHHGRGRKGNSPKVRSPVLMRYSQRDARRELCKAWSCKVYLSRFYQVSFVLFQWTEPASCGWHSSWHKVGRASKALGRRLWGAGGEALHLSSNKPISLDQAIPWNYAQKRFFSAA